MEAVIYAYEVDGEEVMRGTTAELAYHFRVSRGNIYDRIKRGEFVRVGTVSECNMKPAKKTKKQAEMEYLETHLRLYGNTVCRFDPVPYFPDLYDKGLNCRIGGIYPNKMGVTKRKRKNDVHYLVEVVTNGLSDIHE